MATNDVSSYNVEITYQSNLKTGEITILVDYISDAADSVQKHQQDHERFVRQLLEDAGILRGSCSVRIRYGVYENVYRLERKATVWEWQKVSSQQKTQIVHSSVSSLTGPDNKEVIAKKQTP